jgi:hypothetical protein
MSTKQTRRRFSSEFKLKVVLDALKERQSLAELSQKYEVSQVMISRWKSEFLGVTGFFWGVAGEVLVLDFNPRLWTTSC